MLWKRLRLIIPSIWSNLRDCSPLCTLQCLWLRRGEVSCIIDLSSTCIHPEPFPVDGAMDNRKWTIDPDLLAHTQNYRRIFLINSTVQWNPNWFAHTQPVAVGGKYVLGIGAMEQPCLENWAGQLYSVVNHIFKKKGNKSCKWRKWYGRQPVSKA